MVERTAELRRSEAYLSEAQRLTHTGIAALNGATGEVTHSSDEHSRLYGFDPGQGVPSLEEFGQRVHPEDRARWTEALETGFREAASVEGEFRVVPPQGPLKHLHATVHPVFTASGELEEFVGTVVDVTERKRAEEEHQAQLWFLESMDGIDRAIQRISDLEQMMSDVLDVALVTFRCDRAWLVYPCDPDVDSLRVRMERTRPEYIGAFGVGVDIPNEPGVANVSRRVLASNGPVRFDPESDCALPLQLTQRFSIKSMIAMAVHPKVDKPYMFGLHQCSHSRVWTPLEERLFHEIGRRLADALDTLLMFRKPAGKRTQARGQPGRARRLTGADRHGLRRDAAPDRAGSARWSATAARLTRARTAQCAGVGPTRAARVAGAAVPSGGRTSGRARGAAGDLPRYPPGHPRPGRPRGRPQDTCPAVSRPRRA